MTTETVETNKLETEICSRCGGTGSYSYCQMYGTRCFKCQGKKIVLTKRGAVAKAYLTGLRSKTVAELKAGDRIYDRIRGWATVESIRPGDAKIDGGQVVDGVVIPAEAILTTTKCQHHTSNSETFRVFVSEQHEAETLAKAVEFQSTLTKEGKPRKNAKAR